MIELILLKALLKRDNYRAYRHAVVVSEELLPVLNCIDTWFRTNTDDPILEDLVVTLALSDTPKKEYAQEALERLWSVHEPKEVRSLLESVKTAQIAQKLALKSFQLGEGNATVSEVLQLANQLEKPQNDNEVRFVSQNLREILSTTTGNTGLRWRLDWLNKSLGSLRKGDFGFVFARPETGKTTFLASECTFMAEQLSEEDGPILWFNNEEQGSKVQLRCFQSALGITTQALNGNPDHWQARYEAIGGTRLRIHDNAGISAREVEAIVEREQPSLIVFDQIDKIKGFKNDREDLALGAIYQWARELAKSYCPVIGVCQASGEAEGEPYLHMGHVSNARTAKQAEADFILGIGKTHQSGFDFVRYFNISKNKLVGDADTDPQQRHGRQEVLIKPEIARYIEA